MEAHDGGSPEKSEKLRVLQGNPTLEDIKWASEILEITGMYLSPYANQIKILTISCQVFADFVFAYKPIDRPCALSALRASVNSTQARHVSPETVVSTARILLNLLVLPSTISHTTTKTLSQGVTS